MRTSPTLSRVRTSSRRSSKGIVCGRKKGKERKGKKANFFLRKRIKGNSDVARESLYDRSGLFLFSRK